MTEKKCNLMRCKCGHVIATDSILTVGDFVEILVVIGVGFAICSALLYLAIVVNNFNLEYRSDYVKIMTFVTAD